MEYITKIGLEIHIELLTNSKIFCFCKNSFGERANTLICPICLGEPGTLPKLNKEVLNLAIKTGILLNCEIEKNIVFDRKNYFYTDLPKGYQITQFFYPIGKNGYLNIDNKKFKIKEFHIEEDSGKTIYKNNKLYIDYNRAGIGLLEIVTEPIFQTSQEVLKFLQKLKQILKYNKISDCKIEEGSMRVDLNISILKDGISTNRVEIKNIGSFSGIKNAIDRLILKDDLFLIFEEIMKKTIYYREVYNLLLGDFLNLYKFENYNIQLNKINDIAYLINLLMENKITRIIYKDLIEKVLVENIQIQKYIEEKGYLIEIDENIVNNEIDSILLLNQKSVLDYKNGKEKALKYLIGECIKNFKGRIEPNKIKEILYKKLNVQNN